MADWLAFARLEQVGHPVPPDPEEKAKAEREATRAKVEGGLRALMNKQKSGDS